MDVTVQEKLESLIVAFEEGRLSFDDFSRDFSDTYLDGADQLPDSEETRMFDSVHERLEWTTASPPDEDRVYGWSDPSDFREWLATVGRT
jgi:hypothetical protein